MLNIMKGRTWQLLFIDSEVKVPSQYLYLEQDSELCHQPILADSLRVYVKVSSIAFKIIALVTLHESKHVYLIASSSGPSLNPGY